MTRLPALFVPHGSPTMLLDDSPARDFLSGLGRDLPRPRAVLAVTAHWTSEGPVVGAAERPQTIHDFHGFPQALFEMRYPAPGAPDVAARVAALTGATLDTARGLDHGTWVPMMLLYPQADIPVAQLSVQPSRDGAWHRALGRALAPLRDEGVLILASGGITHSLRDWTRFHRQPAAPAQAFAADFAAWIGQRLEEGDDAALDSWRRDAPEAQRNHPTPEHLLPLFVARGAGGQARRLHASSTYGVLMMDVWAFG